MSIFYDRTDAGKLLISSLKKNADKNTVLLAIPRGGVPVAEPIAKNLNLSVDLLMAKKIGHPTHPEYAIGAVTMTDYIIDNVPNISNSYIEQEVKRLRLQLKEQYKNLTDGKEALSLKNKTVIIIDDGIATGNTILSALPMLRRQEVKKIIVATPVIPFTTVDKINKKADELIFLHAPENFNSVGEYYTVFKQVTDDEVKNILKSVNSVL